MTDQKPETQEQSFPKPILQVVLNEDGTIQMKRFTKFIPTICHIAKLLDYEITEMMAQDRVAQDIKNTPRVQVNSFQQLKSFLNRRPRAG